MDIKILSRSDLEQVLDIKAVLKGVEDAYRLKAQGDVAVWPPIEHHFDKRSEMKLISGGVFGDVNVHGTMMINDFPNNSQLGLQSYSGLLTIFDSNTGHPLGMMDASYITCMRTGAAGAISAKALARANARTLLIVGAGRQAFFQLGAILTAMPQFKRVLVCNPNHPDRAEQFVDYCQAQLADQFGLWTTNVSFEPTFELESAVGEADVIVTATRSTSPLIQKDWVKPGTHLICVGADAPEKQEVDPLLFHGNSVFCDDLRQCSKFGEIEIPFRTGVFRQEDFAGEIGLVLNGTVPGRTNDTEITIFDTVGLAALDLVTGRIAVEAAIEKNRGTTAQI